MVTKLIKPIGSIIAAAAIAIMSGSAVYAAEAGCMETSIIQSSMEKSADSINNALSVTKKEHSNTWLKSKMKRAIIVQKYLRSMFSKERACRKINGRLQLRRNNNGTKSVHIKILGKLSSDV